ncbi:MAG TPA: prepilin-type N-terminal cleavage/methylation domain-containing protein [Opitutaceae bacterium]|nr:prepilin-type N-terminal cleavage/methylation domain-containing protein [Opitutaceae bacterium]
MPSHSSRTSLSALVSPVCRPVPASRDATGLSEARSFKPDKDPGLPSGRRSSRGLTLVEVAIALSVLALCLGGILAALLQSRRLTDGSIVQTSAVMVVQGYIEQMKTMGLPDLINATGPTPTPIPTKFDDTHDDPLAPSTGTPPTNLSSFIPGDASSVPAGAVDNLKDFPDRSGTQGQGSPSTWAITWPGANRTYDPPLGLYPTSTPYPGDLHLNLWVWVQNLTGLSGGSTNAADVYGITIIYTWQLKDGAKIRYFMGSVRTIRSKVPTM